MKDTVREAWLTNGGWKYTYEQAVQLEEILIDKSAQEQVRLGEAVNDQMVTRYVQAIRAGAQFPPIILIRANDGNPMPIADGIHRVHAMRRAGVKATDAYIITNADTPKQIEIARRSANAPVGMGLDHDHAANQAVALVDRCGLTAREAAQVMNVHESTVAIRLRARAVAPRVAQAVGASLSATRVLQAVPTVVLDALGRIRRPDLFDVAALIAMRGKLTKPQVEQLAVEANKALVDSDARALLVEWHKTYANELASTTMRGDGATTRHIKNAPQARVDRALTVLKTAVTTIRNHVDGRKLDAKSRKSAAEAIRNAAGELTQMARRIGEGKSATVG